MATHGKLLLTCQHPSFFTASALGSLVCGVLYRSLLPVDAGRLSPIAVFRKTSSFEYVPKNESAVRTMQLLHCHVSTTTVGTNSNTQYSMLSAVLTHAKDLKLQPQASTVVNNLLPANVRLAVLLC